MEPEVVKHMNPQYILNFTNILLHAVPAVVAGIFAAAGAYLTIKYSIRIHAQKISDLELISDWNIRRLDKIFTVHKMRHPEDDLSVPQIRQSRNIDLKD